MTDSQETKFQISEDLDQLVDPENNKYFIMNVTAKRARKITEGARPVVPFDKYEPVKIAAKEFKEGKLKIGLKKQEDEEEEI